MQHLLKNEYNLLIKCMAESEQNWWIAFPESLCKGKNKGKKNSLLGKKLFRNILC